jgi:3-hydroxyacyl-[acyl-carrier-protein] dehydratase
MAADALLRTRVLEAVPHRPPFRFIDEIHELDGDRIVGSYRFREDEYFYAGHFPGRPVTPGVILVEAMAQVGVVALGLYLNMITLRGGYPSATGLTTLFTLAEGVEFKGVVRPGERVVTMGETVYFRRNSLKSRVSMTRENGEEVCSGVLAGMGVVLDEA